MEKEIPADQLPIGHDYLLKHCRFGEAVVHVHSRDDEWVYTTVQKGILRGINQDWLPGDAKPVRISNSRFYPVIDQEKTETT